MITHDFQKQLVIAVLICYFLAGLAIQASRGSAAKEFIPFYSWFLFTSVPNRGDIYVVRLLSHRDRVFDPPLSFNRADGVVADPRSAKARWLIQEFGRAVGTGNVQAIRRRFEQTYLPPRTRYELIRLSYHPLQRWATGRVEIQRLGTFEVTE